MNNGVGTGNLKLVDLYGATIECRTKFFGIGREYVFIGQDGDHFGPELFTFGVEYSDGLINDLARLQQVSVREMLDGHVGKHTTFELYREDFPINESRDGEYGSKILIQLDGRLRMPHIKMPWFGDAPKYVEAQVYNQIYQYRDEDDQLKMESCFRPERLRIHGPDYFKLGFMDAIQRINPDLFEEGESLRDKTGRLETILGNRFISVDDEDYDFKFRMTIRDQNNTFLFN